MPEAHRVKKMPDLTAYSSASFVRPDSLLLKWLEETSAALPKDGMLKVSTACVCASVHTPSVSR